MTAYDLNLYSCEHCRLLLGNKKFKAQVLKDYKYHDRKRLICMDCEALRFVEQMRRLGASAQLIEAPRSELSKCEQRD